MKTRWIRARAAGILAAAAMAAMALSACDGDPQPSETGGTWIEIGSWSSPGLLADETGPSLLSIYMEEHPWVHIELVEAGHGYSDHHDAVLQSLITGEGAPDIAVVDEMKLVEMKGYADEFVNLLDFGAGQYQEDYLPWKWEEASTDEGSTVIGLANDVGGLALCYRADLFQAVGLPTERDDVSAALGDSWADFIAVGEAYMEGGLGRPFVDNATSVFNAALTQLGTGHSYYDRDDNLDLDSIKPAFDTAVAVIEAGISAGIPTWSPDWVTAYENGDFGAVVCPSWMLGFIKSAIPHEDFGGQWDIADIPGSGGNWGGSFYTIPAQGTANEQQEAYAFIEWLLQPDQQVKMMEETGSLSPRISILESPVVAEYSDPFFNNAPYGPIYAQTTLDIPGAIYYGPGTADIRAAIEGILEDVENGRIAIEDAWDAAVAAAEAADQSFNG